MTDKFDQMTIDQMLDYLDVDRATLTSKSYLYVDTDDRLVLTEVRDRTAVPIDERRPIGYVSNFQEYSGLRRPNKPGTAPDTSLFLGDERREWLKANGGIQPTITRLIDEAMGNEKRRYVMTDGHEVTAARMMTNDEFEAAQKSADQASDGNWWWAQDDDAEITWTPDNKAE